MKDYNKILDTAGQFHIRTHRGYDMKHNICASLNQKISVFGEGNWAHSSIFRQRAIS